MKQRHQKELNPIKNQTKVLSSLCLQNPGLQTQNWNRRHPDAMEPVKWAGVGTEASGGALAPYSTDAAAQLQLMVALQDFFF